jgi:hypothetical protein
MDSLGKSEVREDTVIELAPALAVPAIHGETTVEIDRYGTRANTNRDPLKEQTRNSQSPVTVQSPHLSKAHFGENNSGFQAGHIQGSLNLEFHHHAPNHSVFDNLALRVDRFVGQRPARIKDSKTRHRTARLVSHFCALRGRSG